MSRHILPLLVIAGTFAGLLLLPAPARCLSHDACSPSHACCEIRVPYRPATLAVNVTLTVPALVPSRELLLAAAAERGHDGFKA